MTGTTRPDTSGGSARGSLLRTGTVVLAALAVSAGSVALGSAPVLDLHARLGAGAHWSTVPLDLLLGCLAALVLGLCCVWLVGVTMATAVEAATGASSAAIRAVSPHVLRRLVLVCCGVAVGGSGLVPPAVAVAEEPGALGGTAAQRTGTVALSGLPLPDRTLGEDLAGQAVPASAPAVRAVRRAAARHREPAPSGPDRVVDATYRVRPGDSLWSIAERQLPHAEPAEIDAGWRRIHRDNRATIGPDPDVIIPGTTLRMPTRTAGPPSHDGAPGEPGATPHRKDAS